MPPSPSSPSFSSPRIYFPPEILYIIGHHCLSVLPDYELWFSLGQTCRLFRQLVEDYATRDTPFPEFLPEVSDHLAAFETARLHRSTGRIPLSPWGIESRKRLHTTLLTTCACAAELLLAEARLSGRRPSGEFLWGRWAELRCKCVKAKQGNETEQLKKVKNKWRVAGNWHLTGYGKHGYRGTQDSRSVLRLDNSDIRANGEGNGGSESTEERYLAWFEFKRHENAGMPEMELGSRLKAGFTVSKSSIRSKIYSKLDFTIPVVVPSYSKPPLTCSIEQRCLSFPGAAVITFNSLVSLGTNPDPLLSLQDYCFNRENGHSADKFPTLRAKVHVAFDWRQIFTLRCGAERDLTRFWRQQQAAIEAEEKAKARCRDFRIDYIKEMIKRGTWRGTLDSAELDSALDPVNGCEWPRISD